MRAVLDEIDTSGAVMPDLVFAVLMPYLGPEAAEDEMRRVTREG